MTLHLGSIGPSPGGETWRKTGLLQEKRIKKERHKYEDFLLVLEEVTTRSSQDRTARTSLRN